MLHIRILTALALCLMVQPLRASALAIVGDSTMVDLTFADIFTAKGIVWEAIPSATLSSGISGKELLFLPISGGTYANDGSIFSHAGGLRLTHDSNFVEVTSLTFDLTSRTAQGNLSLNGTMRAITLGLQDCSITPALAQCADDDGSILLTGLGLTLSTTDFLEISETLQVEDGLGVRHLGVAHPDIRVPEPPLGLFFSWIAGALIYRRTTFKSKE